MIDRRVDVGDSSTIDEVVVLRDQARRFRELACEHLSVAAKLRAVVAELDRKADKLEAYDPNQRTAIASEVSIAMDVASDHHEVARTLIRYHGADAAGVADRRAEAHRIFDEIEGE